MGSMRDPPLEGVKGPSLQEGSAREWKNKHRFGKSQAHSEVLHSSWLVKELLKAACHELGAPRGLGTAPKAGRSPQCSASAALPQRGITLWHQSTAQSEEYTEVLQPG